jgi:hypothetical protein
MFAGTHKSTGEVTTTRTFPLDRAIEVGSTTPTVISLHVTGRTLEISRDGEPVGVVTLADPDIGDGRVQLGISTEADAPPAGPYQVAFTDVRIWGLGPR